MAPIPKRERRRSLRAQRREISAARDVRADDAALGQSALELVMRLGLPAGSVVLCYESVPGEPPTGAVVASLLAAGMRVLVPETLPDLDLDWRDVTDPDRTRLGPDAVALADLVLAPGLAVDGSGTRLGQGGGCYDRALPRRRPGVPVVVLLHPGEVLDAQDEPLPRDPHDQPVDAALTAEATTDLGAGLTL